MLDTAPFVHSEALGMVLGWTLGTPQGPPTSFLGDYWGKSKSRKIFGRFWKKNIYVKKKHIYICFFFKLSKSGKKLPGVFKDPPGAKRRVGANVLRAKVGWSQQKHTKYTPAEKYKILCAGWAANLPRLEKKEKKYLVIPAANWATTWAVARQHLLEPLYQWRQKMTKSLAWPVSS